MRLQSIRSTSGNYAKCCQCETMHPLVELWMDLDGPPFKAYYCNECKKAPVAMPEIKADIPCGVSKPQ